MPIRRQVPNPARQLLPEQWISLTNTRQAAHSWTSSTLLVSPSETTSNFPVYPITVPQPPSRAEIPCYMRGHVCYPNSSQQLGQRRLPPPFYNLLCLPPKVQPSTCMQTSCSITGHTGKNAREETKNYKENIHQTKTNSEINTYTYNHLKPRWIDTSIRTQSIIARSLCNQQSPAILLQQSLNISAHMKHQKKALKLTL